MRYWAIGGQEGIPEVFLPDTVLADKTHRDGINPITARQAFTDVNAIPAWFQLLETGGMEIARTTQKTSDLLFWSWVPIFSNRARDMCIGLGCEKDDFWPCRFKSNSEEEFFMHLPQKNYDAVDMVKSTFMAILPVTPPIPYRVISLVLIGDSDMLPHCFRATMPGYSQVLSDFFVSEKFRLEWQRNGFIGADFRKIMP